MENNTEEDKKNKQEKTTDEAGSLVVETYLRIFDPENGVDIIRKRD